MTDTPLERLIHAIARAIATDLWRLSDAIQRLEDTVDRAGEAVSNAGHRVLDLTCRWSERRIAARERQT